MHGLFLATRISLFRALALGLAALIPCRALLQHKHPPLGLRSTSQWLSVHAKAAARPCIDMQPYKGCKIKAAYQQRSSVLQADKAAYQQRSSAQNELRYAERTREQHWQHRVHSNGAVPARR